MDELSAVEVFQGFDQLVDHVPDVDVLEDALADHIVQVGLHVLKHQIDVFVVLGSDHAVQFDYVRVVQLMQQRNLTEGTLGISRMLKGIKDLFESDQAFCSSIDGFPYMPVGPAAYLLDELESFEHVFFNFFAHFL